MTHLLAAVAPEAAHNGRHLAAPWWEELLILALVVGIVALLVRRRRQRQRQQQQQWQSMKSENTTLTAQNAELRSLLLSVVNVSQTQTVSVGAVSGDGTADTARNGASSYERGQVVAALARDAHSDSEELRRGPDSGRSVPAVLGGVGRGLLGEPVDDTRYSSAPVGIASPAVGDELVRGVVCDDAGRADRGPVREGGS